MVQERWSTLCKLRPGTESGRIAGQHHSSSDPGPIRPEQLVDPAAVWTRDRVGRESLSGHRSSYPVPRQPGPLVDPASAQIWDQMIRDSWSIMVR